MQISKARIFFIVIKSVANIFMKLIRSVPVQELHKLACPTVQSSRTACGDFGTISRVLGH